MEQETLEEAIKREYEARKFDSVFPFDPQSFALGAEWQAEQDKNKYSEEDMIEFACWVEQYYVQHSVGCYENVINHSLNKTNGLLKLWNESKKQQ